MTPNDIKVGDCYPVLAHVGYKNKKGNYAISINWGDGLMETRTLTPADACAMFSIYETKPKYDPCRLFKKGDKVKRRTVDGRTDQEISAGIELTVIYGEDKYGNVRVQNPNGICIVTKSVFLELVTPVEDLEPYFLFEDTYSWQVKRENKLCCRFGKSTHPHAREAAEAERDRLNAEWRKEQK